MKLFILLIFLSAQICFGSKWMSLETNFIKVEHVLKKIENNPNYGTYCRARTKSANSYVVQLQIPPGVLNYFGDFDDQSSARNAVSMIVEKYKKSLELNSPATYHSLKLKCEEMFPPQKCLRLLPPKLSLIKKIEQNPDYGIMEFLRAGPPSYTVQTRIPPKVNHFYGTLHDKLTARKAVLMLAKEYLESLEEGKSPATVEDLQKKYDAMFGESVVSRFEKKVEKIKKDPNFGVNFLKNRILNQPYSVILSIPPGAVHWYGYFHNHASARKAVLMIAEDYLKSLKDSPATHHELRQKYGSMKKELSVESKLDIAEKNPRNDLLMFQSSQDHVKRQAAKVPSPTSTEEENLTRSSEVPSELTLEDFPNVETNRNPIEEFDKDKLDFEIKEVNGKENVLMSFSKQPMSEVYKVVVASLQVDENMNFPYDLDGWRTHLKRGEEFTVTEKKRLIDNFNGWHRIRGYCEEYGGWVTLKHLDIGLEGAEKVTKRKRKAIETSSESMEESTNYESDNNY